MDINIGLQALKWPYLGRISSELSDSKCVGFPAGPKSARKLNIPNFEHFKVRIHNNDKVLQAANVLVIHGPRSTLQMYAEFLNRTRLLTRTAIDECEPPLGRRLTVQIAKGSDNK